MTFFLRQLLAILRGRLTPSNLIHRRSRRVGLFELDVNWHVNQRIYAGIAELCRLEWLFNSGLWNRWRSQGLNPLVAEQTLIYRRELGPFARYEVDTRPVAVDRRFLHVQHHFLMGDRVHTRVDVKLLFVGPNGVLSPDDVTELVTPILQRPLNVENWQLVS
ncbi:MAG: acyl-CoA thioesterase [Myxococcota bacterium]